MARCPLYGGAIKVANVMLIKGAIEQQLQASICLRERIDFALYSKNWATRLRSSFGKVFFYEYSRRTSHMRIETGLYCLKLLGLARIHL